MQTHASLPADGIGKAESVGCARESKASGLAAGRNQRGSEGKAGESLKASTCSQEQRGSVFLIAQHVAGSTVDAEFIRQAVSLAALTFPVAIVVGFDLV